MDYEAEVVENNLEGAVDQVAAECPEACAIFLRGDIWKSTVQHNAAQLVGASEQVINTVLMILTITGIQFGLDYAAHHAASRKEG